MADELFEAGHLVKLYWTPTPGSSTFEEIGNITEGDLSYGGTSNTTEVIVRGRIIDSYFVSPVIRREERTFQVTRNPGTAQDVALRDAAFSKTVHAFMQRGVDPDGNPSDAYVIESGAITNYTVVNPHGDGPIRAEMAYRPTGAIILDGTTYGA